MPEYSMDMVVTNGALDHWVGETVPLRGPDRRIIGEATVTSVDHRDDDSVSVVVSSKIDTGFEVADQVANLMTGRAPMSFKVVEPAHQPMRDDDVAKWLKAKRDEYIWDGERLVQWFVIDLLLDEYRARADYGFTLDHDMSELEGRW